MASVTNYILNKNYYYNNLYTLNYHTKINIHMNPAIVNSYNIVSSLLDVIDNYSELSESDLYLIHEWIDKLYIPLSSIDNNKYSDLDINYIVSFDNLFIVK